MWACPVRELEVANYASIVPSGPNAGLATRNSLQARSEPIERIVLRSSSFVSASSEIPSGNVPLPFRIVFSDDWEGYRTRRRSVKGTKPRNDFPLRRSSMKFVGVFAPLSGGVVFSTDEGVICDAFGVLLASLEDEDSAGVSDSIVDVEWGGDGVRGGLQIKVSVMNMV